MEVSGYLVGSAAFKAVGTSEPRPAGSIPVHLRHRPASIADWLRLLEIQQMVLMVCLGGVQRTQRQYRRVTYISVISLTMKRKLTI